MTPDHAPQRVASAQAPWFFAEHIPDVGDTVTLDATEAAHAAKSRRKNIREPITVFDGKGTVADCSIASIEARNRSLDAVVLNVHHHSPHTPAVHIATALPKGDRASTMLSMLTQLGVSDITPLLTEHAVVKPTEAFHERALRICIESCKQSRNAWAPTVHPPATLTELTAQRNEVPMFLAHPTGESLVAALRAARSEKVIICIGPEGGFSDAECEAVAPGTTSVSLGATILRIETAAVAAATLARMDHHHD